MATGTAPNDTGLDPLSEHRWPGAEGLPGDQGPSMAIHQLSLTSKPPCPHLLPVELWDRKTPRPLACLSTQCSLPLKKGRALKVPT